jgi:hypothetical protein
MRSLFITAFFLVFVGGEARADITVKDYQARMASGDASIVATTKIYIQGLGDGFGWANTGAKEPTYLLAAKLGIGFGKLSPYY